MSWLFDGISTVITYALVYIEDGLKWIPWPALVLALTLLAFAMGRWSLAIFTALALLYIGFMDLWANTIDTIALMVVAVAVANGHRPASGNSRRPQPRRRQPDAPHPGRDANHAQLRLPAAREFCSSGWASLPGSSPP